MQPHKKFSLFRFLATIFAVGGMAVVIVLVASGEIKAVSDAAATVDLTPSQVATIKIEPVGTHRFRIEKEVIGSVAYHEKDAVHNAHSSGITRFIVANVPESDSPLIHVGQPVYAKLSVYPDQVFTGKVAVLGVSIYDSGGNPAIDPNTHRIAVRCEIADPENQLYPGMFANLVIELHPPVESIAIPVSGVVRKGDGAMTVWVTPDRHQFTERVVKVGLRQDGIAQITEGLRPGELVATDGAIFINNILYAPPTD